MSILKIMLFMGKKIGFFTLEIIVSAITEGIICLVKKKSLLIFGNGVGSLFSSSFVLSIFAKIGQLIIGKTNIKINNTITEIFFFMKLDMFYEKILNLFDVEYYITKNNVIYGQKDWLFYTGDNHTEKPSFIFNFHISFFENCLHRSCKKHTNKQHNPLPQINTIIDRLVAWSKLYLFIMGNILWCIFGNRKIILRQIVR